jgi:hypothetical protein
MAEYSPLSPNAYDQDLIPKDVRAKFFREIIAASPLFKFMGKTELSVIQVTDKDNGSGPTSNFTVFRELDYKNPIKGYDQISGKGQNLKFYDDRVEVTKYAWPARLRGIQLTKLYTPVDVFGELRPALQRLQKRNWIYEILKSATFDNYPDRTGGPVDNRALYSGAAYNASIDTAVGAMGNADYTASGGNVDDILFMRDIARNGGKGAYRAEKVISPYEMEMKDGFADPKYILFLDPAAYRKIAKDPQIQNQVARGVLEASDQPSLLRGAPFRMRIDDVLVYEVPELGDFRVTANGKTAAWNLFCGAQAFGAIFRGMPWMTTEYSDHDTNVEMALHEIRGQKALKFPSYEDESTLIENGIIHYFTRIA